MINNNKIMFLNFKNNILSNFKDIVAQNLWGKINNIDLMHYVRDIDDYPLSVKKEAEARGINSPIVFKEKVDNNCLCAFLKSKKWMNYIKGKFEAEMNLLENLLDNGQSVFLLHDNYVVSAEMKKSLKSYKYGFGDTNKQSVLIFSYRKQEEFIKITHGMEFVKIHNYSDLTKDLLRVIEMNIINEFSNSVAAEDIYNPLYKDYFTSMSLLLGENELWKTMSDINKDNIADIEMILEKMTVSQMEIIREVDANLMIDYKLSDGSTYLIRKSYADKIKMLEKQTPIIGDFPSEFASLYRTKCIEKNLEEIKTRFVLNKENIEEFFEEYNVISLDRYFQYGVSRKDMDVSFVNRYWGDKEIAQVLKMNNLFKEHDLDVKLVILKQDLFVLTNIFAQYAQGNVEIEEQIEIKREFLSSLLPEFSSSEEMIKILFYEDGELILSDMDLVQEIYHKYYEYKAKQEGKTILELALSKNIFTNREFVINDINVAFTVNGIKKSSIWDVRDKIDLFKKAAVSNMGVDIYVYKREAAVDSLVVSINNDVVMFETEKQLSKFYENLITYIWTKEIVVNNIASELRSIILTSKLSIVDEKENRMKKKI